MNQWFRIMIHKYYKEKDSMGPLLATLHDVSKAVAFLAELVKPRRAIGPVPSVVGAVERDLHVWNGKSKLNRTCGNLKWGKLVANYAGPTLTPVHVGNQCCPPSTCTPVSPPHIHYTFYVVNIHLYARPQSSPYTPLPTHTRPSIRETRR